MKGGVVLAGVGFVFAIGAGYALLVPKIGHASSSEVMAALPASLRVVDAPDPVAEGRYDRVVALARRLGDREVEGAMGSLTKPADPAKRAEVLAKGRAVADGVEALLAEGSLRCPARETQSHFEDLTPLKGFSKWLMLATRDAAARGDRTACARYAALNLRFGRALRGDKGVVIDTLVGISVQAIAIRGAYEAEMAGGFDAAGRSAVLAALPMGTRVDPDLAGAIRRDYRAMILRYILEPRRLTPETMAGTVEDDRPRETLAGTFDPVATARLTGRIVDAAMRDAGRPVDAQTNEADALATKAGEGLPPQGSGPESRGFVYRMRMDMGRNTLGRQLATNSVVFGGLAGAAARSAAYANLLRATILLREGRAAPLADPYGKGLLRIDPRRRIVWSVGENGRNDGGKIGKRYGEKAPDLGLRY